jgi:hypothetical protein
MKTNQTALVAVFDDRHEAELALHELEESGFSANHIGLVIRGDEAVHGGMITDAQATKDGRGAVVGAVTGAIAGGLLGAAAMVLIPGVGPVVAAGIFAGLAGGAAAGTAVGGILGAMVGLGISEDEAKLYEQEFQAGKAIVAVRPGTRQPEAEQILRNHGGYNMRFSNEVPTKGVMSEP